MDPGSRIANPYFEKNKKITIFIFVATKKGSTTIFPPSLLLMLLDPGSGINIPVLQHWPIVKGTWQRGGFSGVFAEIGSA